MFISIIHPKVLGHGMGQVAKAVTKPVAKPAKRLLLKFGMLGALFLAAYVVVKRLVKPKSREMKQLEKLNKQFEELKKKTGGLQNEEELRTLNMTMGRLVVQVQNMEKELKELQAQKNTIGAKMVGSQKER